MTTERTQTASKKHPMLALIDRLGPPVLPPRPAAITKANARHRDVQEWRPYGEVLHPGFVTNRHERRAKVARGRPEVRKTASAAARETRYAAFRKVACCSGCNRWFVSTDYRNACTHLLTDDSMSGAA